MNPQRICLRLLGALAMMASIPLFASDAKADLSRALHAQQIPDDARAAYQLVAELDELLRYNTAYRVRIWLLRRDLLALQGAPAPPATTVAAAVVSPLADADSYERDARRYVSTLLDVRLGASQVTRGPPAGMRETGGVYTSEYRRLMVPAWVTNRGVQPAAVHVRLQLDLPMVDGHRQPRGTLECGPIALDAGASGSASCWGYMQPGLAEELTRRLAAAPRTGMAVDFRADLEIGPHAQHVSELRQAGRAADWERGFDVDAAAHAAVEQATRQAAAQTSARARGDAHLSPQGKGIVILLAIASSAGALMHLESGNRPLLPRYVPVAYLLLAAGAVLVTWLDQRSGAPMSGALALMAQMAVGLPGSLLLLSNGVHVPNGSSLPWLFVMANALLLFVFSCPGSRYTTGAGTGRGGAAS